MKKKKRNVPCHMTKYQQRYLTNHALIYEYRTYEQSLLELAKSTEESYYSLLKVLTNLFHKYQRAIL